MTFLVLTVIGFAGMIAHWLKKYLRNELEHDLISYIKTEWRYTALAVLTMLTSIIGLFATVPDISLTQQYMALAFFAGYGFDSALNKV